VAEISLKAIGENLSTIQRQVGKDVSIMAVVKANAYGHGDVEVSKFLEKKAAVAYLGVAFPEEAVRLRKAGIRKPILVFTLPARLQASLFCDFRLEATVCSLEDVKILSAEAQRRKRTLPIHLKIETGMNRIGVRPQGLENLLASLAKAPRLEIKGAFTHFAVSEQKDKSFTLQQLEEFQRGLAVLKKHNISPEFIHCANSGAIMDLPQTHFNLVRPGISLYGYTPARHMNMSDSLRPAMRLKTSVSLVKWINGGESVSYGRRFIAPRKTRIATLPIGYADGYSRLLTNKAYTLIRGSRFPIVGTICMDQLMADVSNEDVGVGEEAVLLGSQGKDRISAWDLAERVGTIPYELLCNVSARVPRVYTHT